MNKIFEIATNISTPLALAGFFAAALFLTFRQILIAKGKELKGLKYAPRAAEKNRIILVIINRLFILALISMILGFTGWTIQKVYKPKVSEKKGTSTINVYVNDKPVSGVSVTADNVRETRTTDVFGMVNLNFDNLPDNDSLHLYFKSNEYSIDSSISVQYKKTYSFNFPNNVKSNPNPTEPIKPVLHKKDTSKPHSTNSTDLNQQIKGEEIKYIGEFDSRLAQIQRFLKDISSTNDEKQKSYLSNGIRAAFNGAGGWYQPTYREFQEVPFFTIVQWFKLNGIKNKFANEVLQNIQNASFFLENNGIYDYSKTHSFVELLQKYRSQFKD